MSEGKRPGGLTALAVFNFIGGGFGLLAVFGFVAILAFILSGSASDPDHPLADTAQHFEEVGMGLLYLVLLLEAALSLLLVVSGIGYLKQKRFLGRTLGNSYGILQIVAVIIGLLVTPDDVEGGEFSIDTILGLIYPVLTLILLNTTFKEDFVN